MGPWVKNQASRTLGTVGGIVDAAADEDNPPVVVVVADDEAREVVDR